MMPEVLELNATCQNMTSLSLSAWVTLISAVLSAAATVWLAYVGARELPRLTRSLGESKFLAADLHELLVEGSMALDEPSTLPSESADANAVLRRVESATHQPSYERVVFEFAGHSPGVTVTPLRLEDMGIIGLAGACGVTLTFDPATSTRPGALEQASSRPVMKLRKNLRDIVDILEASPGPPKLAWHIGVRACELRYRLTRVSSRRIVVDFFRPMG
jgi:hypothetical protein